MRRLIQTAIFVAAAALAAACGDNTSPPQQEPDAGVDAPPTGKVGPCLQKPTDLERAPVTAAGASSALPCELLPPGFVAP